MYAIADDVHLLVNGWKQELVQDNTENDLCGTFWVGADALGAASQHRLEAS